MQLRLNRPSAPEPPVHLSNWKKDPPVIHIREELRNTALSVTQLQLLDHGQGQRLQAQQEVNQ